MCFTREEALGNDTVLTETALYNEHCQEHKDTQRQV